MHGWFDIPGTQTGERFMIERKQGMDSVIAVAKGASVLDLGCAEGLIGKWLIDAGGARLVHGIDIDPTRINSARRIMQGYLARFELADLNSFTNWKSAHAGTLLERYDIVLALAVIHKLADPAAFLRKIASMCGNVLAISLAARTLIDARSGNVPMDPADILGAEFEQIDECPGEHDPVKGALGYRRIFRRVR